MEVDISKLSEDKVLNNPEIESDIFNSIDETFFKTANEFDAQENIIQQLPEELDLQYLLEEKKKFKRQLLLVTKKLSDLILQNQPSYAKELDRVGHLQTSLSEAIKVCTEGRHYLDYSKRDFTLTSLKIVANYQRREVLKNLIKSLQTIKTLQQTDIRLRELLEDDEDYPGAIQLCLECQKVVSSLKHYTCISELSSKLQDTLEMTEEQIDIAAAKLCTDFNTQLYVKLQTAYKLLGKTQTAVDQLLMHFASAIHNKAFRIVLGYVELCASTTNPKETNFSKRQYHELCRFLMADSFQPCLIDLCRALWDIMLNYKKILTWHAKNDVLLDEETSVEDIDLDENFSQLYVKQKLEHGLGRVWQDVQQKLRVLMLNNDLSNYSFDDFIKVLDLLETMVHIGEEFSGSKSEDLQESIRTQTLKYFSNYHRDCMERLRMFLDNELWTMCPVTNFSLIDLQEFNFLQTKNKSFEQSVSPSTPRRRSYYFTDSVIESDTVSFPFELHVKAMSNNNESLIEDKMDDICNIPTDEIESNNQSNKIVIENSQIIVTNTTLNVLRSFGQYMQMMNILRPIAFDVLLCMFHLFDYYLYVVYYFFGREMCLMNDTCLTNKLRATLFRIKDALILNDSMIENGTGKFRCPTLSNDLQINTLHNLFGLAERVVAVESLVFLAEQFSYLKQYIERLIPDANKEALEQYVNETILVAPDLRQPVYFFVSVKGVDYEKILSQMSFVRWDVREIMSQHNEYVNLMLHEMNIFNNRVMAVQRDHLGIEIPKEAQNLLWEQLLRLMNRTFIEGFSHAKKCTNEGRALMQLDYQHFLTKIKNFTTVRPIPERELVDEYIKAFYLTEPALEQWIKCRKEYTTKQLVSLISCVTPDNKKGRNKLIAAIDSDFPNSNVFAK